MTTTDAWDDFCDISVAAANPLGTLTLARAGECEQCLRPLDEHEFTTDHWGDSVRICPEEDWWNTDRELAWRRRQAGELR